MAVRLAARTAVVQRGNDRLSRARGGHDQVAVSIVNDALRLDRVEHLLLVREGRT